MSIDLLLIDPPLSMSKRYGHFAICGSKSPQLGLCYIAAAVRREGFNVKILDMDLTKMGDDSFREYLLKEKPRVVGTTATTIAISDAARVAQVAKDTLPGVCTIVGGPHLSCTAEATMLRYPQFDIGVIGEGELTVIDLLNLPDPLKGSYSEINGLVWRSGDKVAYSKPRELIQDVNWLPLPAVDLVPDLESNYIPPYFSVYRTPSVVFMTTRGCPSKCTFCTNAIHGNRIRRFSLDYLFEMLYLYTGKYGIKEVSILDDSFTINKQFVIDFCERLIRENIDLTWSCLTRINSVSPDLLSVMKRAGCWQISYGIESGDNEMLKKIKKGITVEQVREAVSMTKRSGIKVKGFFIMGFAEETHESLKKTLDLAIDLPIDDMSLTIFTPYPGTPAHADIHKYGEFNEDWDAMTTLNASFIPSGFSRDELLKLNHATYRKFYFRPRIFFSYLRRISEFKFIFIMLKGMIGLLSTLFLKDKDQFNSKTTP